MAQIIGPPEPLVSIDGVLTAKGKEFRGSRAGVVRILDVTREDGQVKCRACGGAQRLRRIRAGGAADARSGSGGARRSESGGRS